MKTLHQHLTYENMELKAKGQKVIQNYKFLRIPTGFYLCIFNEVEKMKGNFVISHSLNGEN
ncbi:hypothetical protein HanXRQr2_Chr13g0567041 [Helianthus annuus]|uniref:Uncharacterized protein n=1 Tax=Helianthus annuus TaxID=4232 RepID=A0A9K3EFY3_HELAN|nr:hypothetical protein HanXRQr2_Chr13g0567041 [Helianthus annuus]KAJ0847514.1 hypothetical protein HanPSC8_Chr13g0546141 [Helianthus annuus]